MSDSIKQLTENSLNWRAQCPPSDFATRVAELSAAELSATEAPATAQIQVSSLGRSVVLPLLFAAIFLSAGAYAGKQLMQQKRPPLSLGDEAPLLPHAQRDLRFEMHSRTIAQERELEHSREAQEEPTRLKQKPQPTDAKAEPAPVTPQVETPTRHIVPSPRCTCGSSGVVCSCFE